MQKRKETQLMVESWNSMNKDIANLDVATLFIQLRKCEVWEFIGSE